MAIIPDGNRRWAKERSLLPWKGHEQSAKNFEDICTFCREHDQIHTLTMWVFSTENWKRDSKEVQKLMEMFEHYLQTERENFHTHQTRFCHSGRKDRLSDTLRELLSEIEEETSGYSEFTLNIALDYGGLDEIDRAAERMQKQDSSEKTLRQFVDHPEISDIDIVIRTSGESRTSGFFPIQSAYAEWIFIEKHFPDFATNDITAALEEYQSRNRRFGS